MSTVIMLLFCSLATGLVATWEKLIAPEPRKRALGGAALIILLVSVGIQGHRDISAKIGLESVNTFLSSQEIPIEEASGASFLNGAVFVVDDESPNLYEYRYNNALGKASLAKEYRIRSGPKTQTTIDLKIIDKVDDLEAVAAYNNRLYLITSYSLNKKNLPGEARELILEIDRFETLPGEAVAHVGHASTLIHSIEQALGGAEGTLVENEGRFNIEGLAIDDKGSVYIGFRNPLLKKDKQHYAIVLQTTVKDIFSKSPNLKVIALRLEDDNKNYGITSLEYDRQSNAVLVLGNKPRKDDDPFLPRLWRWSPNGQPIQEPALVSQWSLKIPEKFDAKPEALAFSADGGPGFVFIDAPGHGGQRKFSREKLGLDPYVGR